MHDGGVAFMSHHNGRQVPVNRKKGITIKGKGQGKYQVKGKENLGASFQVVWELR